MVWASGRVVCRWFYYRTANLLEISWAKCLGTVTLEAAREGDLEHDPEVTLRPRWIRVFSLSLDRTLSYFKTLALASCNKQYMSWIMSPSVSLVHLLRLSYDAYTNIFTFTYKRLSRFCIVHRGFIKGNTVNQKVCKKWMGRYERVSVKWWSY